MVPIRILRIQLSEIMKQEQNRISGEEQYSHGNRLL